MRKNWFEIGKRDYESGRVSLLATILAMGDRGAAASYQRGRELARRSGFIPYYTDGPGYNRIHENHRNP